MQNVYMNSLRLGCTNGIHSPHLCEWDGGVLGGRNCGGGLFGSRRGGVLLDSSCDKRFAILREFSGREVVRRKKVNGVGRRL